MMVAEETVTAAEGTANDLKRKVRSFISQNRAASLATVDAHGMPHVAIVYCFVDEELNLYFSTRVEGRKYQNLLDHPVVSITLYDEKTLSAVQLTGKAERVQDLKLEQDILHQLIMLRRGEPTWPMPPIKLFERGATNELAIIKVIPTEMTYADFLTTETGRYKPFFRTVI